MISPPCMVSIPDGMYRASCGVSNSELKLLEAVGPVKFKHYLDNPSHESTKAKDIGDVFHSALLQPDIEKKIAVRPSTWKDYKTRDAQDWRKQQESNGMIVLTEQEVSVIQAMVKSVKEDPDAGPLLVKGVAEQSIYSIHEETGIMRKGRVDWLPDKSLFSNGVYPQVDIKSCEDASEDGFRYAIRKYKYYRQAGYYHSIMQAIDPRHVFIFIAVEKEPPYLVNVFQLDELDLARGEYESNEALRFYKQCQDSGWTNKRGIKIISM